MTAQYKRNDTTGDNVLDIATLGFKGESGEEGFNLQLDAHGGLRISAPSQAATDDRPVHIYDMYDTSYDKWVRLSNQTLDLTQIFTYL